MALRDAIMTTGMVLIALVTIVGAFIMIALGNAVPQEVWYLETTLVGAIAGTTIPRKETV